MKIDFKKIELFGKKGDRVRIKQNVVLIDGSVMKEGEEFIIEDIVGLGFDLAYADTNVLACRFINSKMFKYFDKVNVDDGER